MQPSFDDALRDDGLVLVICANCGHEGFILGKDGWRCGKCNEWARAPEWDGEAQDMPTATAHQKD